MVLLLGTAFISLVVTRVGMRMSRKADRLKQDWLGFEPQFIELLADQKPVGIAADHDRSGKVRPIDALAGLLEQTFPAKKWQKLFWPVGA